MVNKATLNNKHLIHRNRLLGIGNDFHAKLDRTKPVKKPLSSQSIDLNKLSGPLPTSLGNSKPVSALPQSQPSTKLASAASQSLSETSINPSKLPENNGKIPHQVKPYWDTIQSECAKKNIDPLLVASMIRQESNFNPMAISKHNAMGLMQITPGTAKELNLSDPFDPKQNIQAGVHYLSKMLNRFGGDEKLALAAYNAGPGNVQKYGNTIPPFTETRNYVKNITRFRDSLAVHGTFNRPTQKFV